MKKKGLIEGKDYVLRTPNFIIHLKRMESLTLHLQMQFILSLLDTREVDLLV